MKVRVEKDIVIPAGTILYTAPQKIVRYVPYVEAIIGYGRNHTASFSIDMDAVQAFPEQFKVLDE